MCFMHKGRTFRINKIALEGSVSADGDGLLTSISDDVVEKVILWHFKEENSCSVPLLVDSDSENS